MTWPLITRLLSSSGTSHIKTAKANIGQKTDCDRQKQSFMIDEATVSLRRTLVHTFVC